MLTVGAYSHEGTVIRTDDVMAGYSSRGPTAIDFAAKPDVVAPGTGIVSLSDPGSLMYVTKVDYLLAGSLFRRDQAVSEPHRHQHGVAGRGGHRCADDAGEPGLTPNMVKAILQYTAQSNSDYNALTQGAGFLNSYGARCSWPGSSGRRSRARALTDAAHVEQAGHLGQPSHHRWRDSTECERLPAGTTWGAALDGDGDNIVWGTLLKNDGDNLVWGTADPLSEDNMVWGTVLDCGTATTWSGARASTGDNIVWGTDGDDNIVWGTDCGGGDCDNLVWGTPLADNLVWGTALSADNLVWGTAALGDNLVWGNERGRRQPRVGNGSEDDNMTWGNFG